MPNLPDILSDIWHYLELDDSASSPWKTPTLANLEGNRPAVRTLILRQASFEHRRLRCYTDLRSTKINSIRQNSLVAWHIYDHTRQIQVRLHSTMSILTSGPKVDQAWNNATPTSRLCYLASYPPGMKLPSFDINLPEHLRGTIPTETQLAAGRHNFAVLESVVDHIDYLKLDRQGNIRAEFQWDSNDWQSQWIAA